MTPSSGALCASEVPGSMPGSASAAAISAADRSAALVFAGALRPGTGCKPSVAATPAAADGAAATRALLALVDMLRELCLERIGVEAHRRSRSEERRVGKECRSRGSPEHRKIK